MGEGVCGDMCRFRPWRDEQWFVIVVLSMKAGLCMVESWEEGDGCAWYLAIAVLLCS